MVSISDYISIHWLLINTIIFGIIYQCVFRYWNYFSKNNVKCVRGIPFIGAHWRGFTNQIPLYDSFQNVYMKHPNERFIGVYELGGVPSYYIRDPELVKQVGIKDFEHFQNHQFFIEPKSDPYMSQTLFFMRDERWKDMRSTLSPAFTGSKMKSMFGLITEICERFCKTIKEELKNGPKIYDLNELVERFANDVIASCAFGIEIDSLKDRDNLFYKTGVPLSRFEGTKGIKFLAYLSIPKVMNWLKISVLEQKEVNYFGQILKDNIKYREQNNVYRNDMVNLLIEAKKGALSNGVSEEDKDSNMGFATIDDSTSVASGKKIQKWTDEEVLAQTLIFFLAGFGTVSKTLSFALHEVTVAPTIQQKLFEETQDAKEQLNGKTLTYDVLQKLKYVDMVMSETLRRWPQVPASDRYVNKPYVLEKYDGTKVQLNVGDSVLLPSVALHMDPKFFPNPKTFDPERFSDENKDKIVPGSYLPFGIGPRSCIASRFALMECKAIILYMVSNFHFEMCHKTQHPLKLKTTPGIADAEKGFWVQLRNREN